MEGVEEENLQEIDTLIEKENNYIIGVGASAGGLQALNSFFSHVSQDSKCTYVVVQHLSPDHKSLMGELLSKNTSIPIVEITDDSPIERNRIYLIPPDKNLIIRDNHLRLLQKPTDKRLNLPIDLFFESLAEHSKNSCVAVVLSGTGSDGSRGIKAVKDHGGLVIAQQPEQAKFDGMPRNAIKTGYVDFIIPTEQMSSEIDCYFRTPEHSLMIRDIEDYTEEQLGTILNIISEKTNLDFNLYKKPTLIRRIHKRMKVAGSKSLESYKEYLYNHPEEIKIIYNEFLIGVTKFFRDVEAWDILENKVIPRIVANKEPDSTIKIWDVGCSTGEETYSIAMLFHEEMLKQDKRLYLKVFATDISSYHLDIASRGEYSLDIETDVSAIRLDNFFQSADKGYKIKDALRKDIIFTNHNIIKDPPFLNMDMVICRNMLIYLQSHIQANALRMLHSALRIDGILFLGTSESLGDEASYFDVLSRKWKIFVNKERSAQSRTEVLRSTMDRQPTHIPAALELTHVNSNKRFREEAQHIISNSILDHYGAASVYVDEELNVIDAQGGFRKYAKLPTHGFSVNLLQMLEDRLRVAVSTSVRKAIRELKKIVYRDVQLKEGERQIFLDVIVDPIRYKRGNRKDHFVVTFIETTPKKFPDTIVEEMSDTDVNERIKHLEEELIEARLEVKNAIEDAETSNEELQGANEELLASNEELQSTNEELQSVNEELHTVNAEHIQKMEDLAQLNADMDNLLDSTNIGTIFVDKNLRIRKFTPAIKVQFELLKHDIGRNLDNFVTNFGDSENSIVKHVQEVIETGVSVESNIENRNGKSYVRRITPFLVNEGAIDGAVITFVDITKIKESQEQLKQSEEKFKFFYEYDPVMHASVDPYTGLIRECNQIFVETLGFETKDDIIGRPIIEFYTPKSKLKAVTLLEEFRKTGNIHNQEMVMIKKNKKKLHVLLNSEATFDENGKVLLSRSTLFDISELKKAQTRLRQQKEDLQRANKDLEQFVSICSHDLKEPLGTIRFTSDMLQKRFGKELGEKGQEYTRYIYDAAGRMGNQITGLLEHSKIGREKKKKLVDVKELVEVVRYDLKQRIDDCGANIFIGKMPTIEVYEMELRLLFQNLIGNSLKYCREGVTPDIRISSYKEGDYWVFSIVDNGIGMAEEDMDTIFQIFGRVPSSSEKYEGTGVGLAHCKKIVELHDGRIWVDSQVGVGSTFYFKLKVD